MPGPFTAPDTYHVGPDQPIGGETTMSLVLDLEQVAQEIYNRLLAMDALLLAPSGVKEDASDRGCVEGINPRLSALLGHLRRTNQAAGLVGSYLS